MTLVGDILARAHALAGPDLDRVARQLHEVGWDELTGGLTFAAEDTGGGCAMLAATTSYGTRIGITDGEAGLPRDLHDFWLALMDEDEEELYAVQVRGGLVEWQGGTLV